MKIYGIYQGCEHEGGGIGNDFYNDKGRAIIDAKNLILKEKVQNNRIYKEVESNTWKCGSDVIQVIERDLTISYQNKKLCL